MSALHKKVSRIEYKDSTSEQREHSSRQAERRPFTAALIRIANSKVPNDPRGRTYADLVAEAMFLQAINGNVRAARDIADRLEGRVSERPAEQDRRPAVIKVVYDPPLKPTAAADAQGPTSSSTLDRHEYIA